MKALGFVAKGGTFAFASRLAYAGLYFATLFILARLLSVSDMGTYFVALSVIGFLALFVGQGLPGLAQRSIGLAVHRGDREYAWGWMVSALKRCAVTAILTAGALMSIYMLIRLRVNWPMISGAVLFFVLSIATATAIQNLLTEVHRAHGRIISASLYSGTLTAATTLLALTILFLTGIRLPIEAVLATLLACTIATLIAAYMTLPNTSPWSKPVQARVESKQFRPYWVQALATYGFVQVDLWIAAWLLPVEHVAMYGAANRLAQTLALPVEAIESALPPVIVSLSNEKGRKELAQILIRSTLVQTMLTGIGLLSFLFAGSVLLAVAFGPTYATGAGVLSLLAAGWFVRACCGPWAQTLMLNSQTPLVAKMTAGWLVGSLPGMWFACTTWGSVGLAAAAALAVATFNVAGALVEKKIMRASWSATPPVRGPNL
ncbi:lipopolysaccharide biosynthesis protein [Noviherbaspirillum sp.]|uniref:lipopolysaccharide biosynthesis protein n=1 Tax=Noviherbaspirillum sp. TaxID=1926288 RepID=UPI002FE08F06